MPKSKEAILNPVAIHLPGPPSQVVTDGGIDGRSLSGLAEVAINEKWTSLGRAPGAPKGAVTRLGPGYFREYEDGRIYYHRDLGPFWVMGDIFAKYVQLGGPSSWLGWPKSDEEPFEDGRGSAFQNGNIFWWQDTGAIDVGQVAVHYMGLFCFGETDEVSASDEPYAILTALPRTTGVPLVTRSQIYEGVDAGDSREDNIELYRGLPYGLEIVATVMDHDLVDPDKYLETIKIGVAKASEAVALGLAQIPYVGSFVAPVGEALLKAAGPDIAGAINGLVGGDDDHIGTVNLTVSARDMVRLCRADRANNHGILWHLDSPLISDGEASYKIYIDIRAL